jgi:hypothetical protein
LRAHALGCGCCVRLAQLSGEGFDLVLASSEPHNLCAEVLGCM